MALHWSVLFARPFSNYKSKQIIHLCCPKIYHKDAVIKCYPTTDQCSFLFQHPNKFFLVAKAHSTCSFFHCHFCVFVSFLFLCLLQTNWICHTCAYCSNKIITTGWMLPFSRDNWSNFGIWYNLTMHWWSYKTCSSCWAD